MELAPRAVTLTSVEAEDYNSLFAPQELLVVGGVNGEPQAAIANITTPETFADLAAARTAVAATDAKVNAILGALRGAGIIAT